MEALLPLFDAFWSLMWFPLINLDPGYALLACPLLLLFVTGVFGSVFGIFRRF